MPEVGEESEGEEAGTDTAADGGEGGDGEGSEANGEGRAAEEEDDLEIVMIGPMTNLARALAIDLARHEIRVNAIAPGPFPTWMLSTGVGTGLGAKELCFHEIPGQGADGAFEGGHDQSPPHRQENQQNHDELVVQAEGREPGHGLGLAQGPGVEVGVGQQQGVWGEGGVGLQRVQGGEQPGTAGADDKGIAVHDFLAPLSPLGEGLE